MGLSSSPRVYRDYPSGVYFFEDEGGVARGFSESVKIKTFGEVEGLLNEFADQQKLSTIKSRSAFLYDFKTGKPISLSLCITIPNSERGAEKVILFETMKNLDGFVELVAGESCFYLFILLKDLVWEPERRENGFWQKIRRLFLWG